MYVVPLIGFTLWVGGSESDLPVVDNHWLQSG